MKNNTVMKIKCVECKKKYSISSDELDNYNIYWIPNNSHSAIPFIPQLLCPECTKLEKEKI